jgi:protein-tyrosine phosphatase
LHVLFVCTGNICRSPTAERLALTFDVPGLTTSSAGTRAVVGHGVHPLAARVLAELGGDGTGFAARQLNSRLASDADVVITMTMAHRDVVLELAPHQLRKTFTLIEAALLVTECGARTLAELAERRAFLDSHAVLDVPDPIGHTSDVFTAVAHQINGLLQPVLPLCQPE